jgi:hypothetical protein
LKFKSPRYPNRWKAEVNVVQSLYFPDIVDGSYAGILELASIEFRHWITQAIKKSVFYSYSTDSTYRPNCYRLRHRSPSASSIF